MAAGATYEPIVTTTLGAGAATINLTSIPSTYTDLRIVAGLVTSDSATSWMYFNSTTTTTYSQTQLYGNGTSVLSSNGTNMAHIDVAHDILGGFTDGVTPNIVLIDIFSYAGSTNKTCLIQYPNDKNGSGIITTRVGLWRSTSAITTVSFARSSGSYDAGSFVTIYGIKAA